VNCPFCDEEIKDRALVCKHCGHDLLILRPVLDRFQTLEARLETVEAALQTISGHVDTVRLKEPSTEGTSIDITALWKTLARIFSLVALLLIAHWVIIGVLDLNTWILRVVSILIPLPFGLIGPKSLRTTLGVALISALLAVWGMLVVTSAIDHVPVLPQGSRDWIETLEYVASIALAYGTGHLVGTWRRSRLSRDKSEQTLVYEMAMLLARTSAPRNESRVHTKQRVESIANWLNILALIITAACSIATGVGRFVH